MPACLSELYVTATPIPIIPNAKNPGTNFNTVAPQVEALYKSPFVAAAVLTCVETGPIKLVPISIATNPPIKFAIILLEIDSQIKRYQLV